MKITNFDIDSFLREYWQQKPLLIRQPWAKWRNPFSADELAGLSMEAEVESRLVTCEGDGWAAENGPFSETQFAQLDGKAFTLLVQAVNHYVGDVAALIEAFRFIPDWRIDDVMVSYASNGGGVGPHYDQYDVFLIQGAGRRQWKVGQHCDADSPLLPHDDLRLLAEFESRAEYILEPGDMLYIPPGIAHDGVALDDDCMTYSVGFRAPSRGELIGDWSDDLLATITDDDRYGDVGLVQQDNPGEIKLSAIDGLHRMITDKLSDRDAFAKWFGEYCSAPKYADMDWAPDEKLEEADIAKICARGPLVMRNPASRLAFTTRADGTLFMFFDGESCVCSGEAAEFVENICAVPEINLAKKPVLDDKVITLLTRLYNLGSIAFDI